jgi:hypothetical protein
MIQVKVSPAWTRALIGDKSAPGIKAGALAPPGIQLR